MASVDPMVKDEEIRPHTRLTQRLTGVHPSWPTAVGFRSAARAALSKIGLYDFLTINRQPYLVTELSTEETQPHLRIAYCNPALLEHSTLHEDLREQLDIDFKSSGRSKTDFSDWILAERADIVASSSYLFGGFVWSNCCMIENRYIVISGLPANHAGFNLTSGEQTQSIGPMIPLNDQNRDAITTITKTKPHTELTIQDSLLGLSFDLTKGQYDIESLSPHLRYVVTLDWSKTSLGNMSTWNIALRTAFNMCMTEVSASCLFWGKDNVLIYNDAYPCLIQGSHPCVGKPVLDALPRYAEVTSSIINQIRESGQTVCYEDLPLFYSRDGNDFTEGYFGLKSSPLLDEEGKVAGIYQLITESTNRILLQRRIDNFIDIGAKMMEATSLPDIWHLIIDSMAINDKDIPFAVLYSLTEDLIDVKGSINVPKGHPTIVKSFRLESDDQVSFGPLFTESIKMRRLLLVHVADGSLPEALVTDINSQAFGDAIRSVAISPILNGNRVLGFLVIGCNPRRPFDEAYSMFVTQLSRMIASGVASTTLLEQASKVQADLHEQLTDHQRRLEQQGKRFRALAERIGVAIFVADVNGRYTFRNDTWFKLFPGAARDIQYQTTCQEMLDVGYLGVADHLWQELRAGKEQLRIELKLKQRWDGLHGFDPATNQDVEYSTWVLASAFPTLRDDGSVEEITCAFTDISHQKFSERTQQLQTNSAQDARRQLEQFIDTTSHEIRNPLSAITHCADDLLSTAKDFLSCHEVSPGSVNINNQIIKGVQESAEIIVSCCSHMKRIVDDTLTISKLNGNLLVITPIESQPIVEMERILRLYKAEADNASVDLQPLSIAQRFRELNIDCVQMDSVRFAQIMVNLISNAIKFTRYQKIRQVKVVLDAADHRPLGEFNNCRFLTDKAVKQEASLGLNWPDHESVFILINVTDTGKGLTPEEADTLFHRFAQASPRTYIQYGGNGLGLYISRKIVELHGGAIGFCSTPGAGSTFSFYIKARRSSPMLQSSSMLDSNSGHQFNIMSELTKDIPVQSSASRTLEPGDWERLSILVVEDNLVNQKVLAKQLRKLGSTVFTANDGFECLSKIQQTKYWTPNNAIGNNLSIVLLDWEMPNCDGLTCARRIREWQKAKQINGNIPVLGMTANVRPQQIEQALAAGMDDVISKPFKIVELQKKIINLLNEVARGEAGSKLPI